MGSSIALDFLSTSYSINDHPVVAIEDYRFSYFDSD